MAWESSRPVPWRRLIREWLIYVVIAAALISIYYVVTDRKFDIGLFVGLFASGPAYVLFGAVLAKLGYERKTFKDLRANRPQASTDRVVGSTTSTGRARPAPTKRTTTGPSQHRKSNKPRRR